MSKRLRSMTLFRCPTTVVSVSRDTPRMYGQTLKIVDEKDKKKRHRKKDMKKRHEKETQKKTQKKDTKKRRKKRHFLKKLK